MKRSTLKLFLSVAAVMGVVGSAYADIILDFTFATGPDVSPDANVPEAGGGFVGGQYSWFPLSESSGAVRQVTTTGGWTLGATGPEFEFGWPSQAIMQETAANYPQATVTFDLFVDGTTLDNWGSSASTWYQLVCAGNSNNGWTQVDLGNYDISDGTWSHTFSVPFTKLGWGAGTTWFQLFFGSNSDDANPVQFCIDPLCVYTTPEPSTLALAGLGAVGLLMFRRRGCRRFP